MRQANQKSQQLGLSLGRYIQELVKQDTGGTVEEYQKEGGRAKTSESKCTMQKAHG